MRKVTEEELRAWCASARTRPVPVSEAIDMCQRAADTIEELSDFYEEIRQRGDM